MSDADFLNIDFRFVEIEHELWALEEYIRALEEQLPLIRQLEEERLQTRISDPNFDEDDANIERQLSDDFTRRVLPRFFRGPVLVTLWAIYESAINEIAKYIKHKQNFSLGIRDIWGDNSLSRTRKYFDHVLNFPLLTDPKTSERLEMLLILRNALTHGNGRKDAINEKQWSKIHKWHEEKIGVVIIHDNLMFTSNFVKETFVIVSDLLRDLIKRTRNTY